MTGTYDPWLVCLSIIVAILVSYTALVLAVRVSNANRASARLWLGGGAVAMGGGIWSMHFVGMLAFSLPISLSYDISRTLGSLAIAIAHLRFRAVDRRPPKITLTASRPAPSQWGRHLRNALFRHERHPDPADDHLRAHAVLASSLSPLAPRSRRCGCSSDFARAAHSKRV